MAEQTNPIESEPLAANKANLGEMLQQAREARHLSNIEVAKMLRLKVQWVVDIENNQFQSSIAPIYIRGYLRSYARLVGISPEAVIAAFDECDFAKNIATSQQQEDQFIINQPILSYSRRHKNRRRVARWLGLIVLVVLIAMVVFWWRSDNHLRGHGVHSQAGQEASVPLVTQPSSNS